VGNIDDVKDFHEVEQASDDVTNDATNSVTH